MEKEAGKADGRPKDQPKELSKKQKKLQNRLSIFDLKMMSNRPDLVEQWDTTAADPLFLLQLKQVRNSVPVPIHWQQKRRYLQYKRGVSKKPFTLPEFIENTGINRVRDRPEDSHKSLKQRMRERIQPKMGKIDIDYNILHDAFFKHQVKPDITKHGEIYFEGKENEVTDTKYKPGRMSAELCEALGIAENAPPPWIMNMQKYGPPPAYPNLRIPGVNIPIPDSIRHRDGDEGGLFKDENGLTVYADCHGLNRAVYQRRITEKTHWGELQDDESESEEEESVAQSSEEEMLEDSEFADDEEEQVNFANIEPDLFKIPDPVIPAAKPSFEDLKSGITSLISGTASAAPAEKKELYQVLPQVESKVSQNEVYGTTFKYELPKQVQPPSPKAEEAADAEPSKPKDKTKKKDKDSQFKF